MLVLFGSGCLSHHVGVVWVRMLEPSYWCCLGPGCLSHHIGVVWVRMLEPSYWCCLGQDA